MSDFNIYDDLELLHTQQKQKEGEELQWKEKYNVALETIQKLQVEKKELNKKVKQLEINFASLLDTARTEIKRKDNQINQLRREKDDICFRRDVRPTKKHSIDENVSEDVKSDCGYVNPFCLSKPVDEKNKVSTSRQRNGEYEEKNKRPSYREPRSESALGRGSDRDRSRHLTRKEHRRKDNRDSDHRRDRYDRTSSQARSSDSSRETADKGQSSHTHRAGYTKEGNQTKSTSGYGSSSKYENYSKAKSYTSTERNSHKEKETKTSNGRSDDGLTEKVPQIEKLHLGKNADIRKSSALEKEILNDVKELKKAKLSQIENETATQIADVEARTEKSNNFLDALFDDMVLNGEEQTNDLYNDLPPETIKNDKIEPKVFSPKTDENCNVEPVIQTPLKQPVNTLLDDLFGPSPAKSAAVGGKISLSPVGESSEEVDFVSKRDETKKNVDVSNLTIDVSSAKCSKADKPMTNSDEVKIKNLPNPVSERKAFRFIELDSSFYSSDEDDDDKTSNAIDTRESQSDIDSPPFEKCQLLRSDFKSKEQTSEAKEIITEPLLPRSGHDDMTSVNVSCRKESILTTLPDYVKRDQCGKSSSQENISKAEIACNSTAKNEKNKGSSHKDNHRHHHSSQHAKSLYSDKSSNEKHRHRSEKFRREEGKHHHHHHLSKELTKSVRTSQKNEKRSPSFKEITNVSKEKKLKETVKKLVCSEDIEDRTQLQEKQTDVHEDTSSDLKLYHDKVIALHCDEISDEDGVEADPPKMSDAGSKDAVPRTLEDLVISLQCEDLSDEEEMKSVVEANNGVAKDSKKQTVSENFVAEPFDGLNCKEGELVESHVNMANMEQIIDSNNVVIQLNNDEPQSSVNNGQPTVDMNQPCPNMIPVESTNYTADEFCENKKEALENESSHPVCPKIESQNSPPESTNSLPLALSHEQPSSQDSTDVFPSGGRRKKLKTPRKNTNAGTALKHSSATDLKSLLPHRWTKSDDEYGLAVTKQADASNLHPRRTQSTSNLEEASTSSGKEFILPEVAHSGEADVTVLHKTCLLLEEELQKEMSPLWVEEESTEAAITSEEQSEMVLETKKREDFSEINPSVNKNQNRGDDDKALVTTSKVQVHNQNGTIQVPSLEESDVLSVSESTTDSTAGFASESGKNGIPTDSIVIPESIVTSDGTQHVTGSSSLIDARNNNTGRGLPNASIEVIKSDAKNDEFVQKSIDLDVNDNQKDLQGSKATGDTQKKGIDRFKSPIKEKQFAASGNSAPGCDKEPVVSKSTVPSDDKKMANDNRKEPSLKDVAKRGRKNKFMKDDQKSCLTALDFPGEQPVPTSGSDGVLSGNILQAATRCVVKLPILPIFSCFDGKNSDSPLTVHQQVEASDVKTKLNSKLLQDAPLSNEKQSILPLSDVKNSDSPLIDTNGKPNSDHLQHLTRSDVNPPTTTESLKLVGEKFKSAPTDEQQVPTSDIRTNSSALKLSINSEEKPSDHLPADEKLVKTSGTVLPNDIGSDEKKIIPVQLKCDNMGASDDKSTSKHSLNQNSPDLDSASENNKKNSPSDQSVISLDSAIHQSVATNTQIKKYKKRILNSFNNSKIAAQESDKQYSTGSEIESPVTSCSKRKRAKAILEDSSDSAGNATIEGLKTTDVESPSTSEHKTKQRKRNAPEISCAHETSIHTAFHTKNGQTEQLSTATNENFPTSGTKQKHERRHTDSGKKHLAVIVLSDANKKDEATLKHSPDCNAVAADTHEIDQQTSVAKRKYKKRSSLDSEIHRPTVAGTSDGARILASSSTEDIQNHIPIKTVQQPISNDPQDIASCTSNSNVLSSNESQIHDEIDSNAIFIKRKIKPNKHPKKRRKCSTSSSDTINLTSDSQSMMASSSVSDVLPSPTATEKLQLSVSTPAVTPTHHKIFNEDVYPEDQPPPEYNANGDDIQYQEIDNRMRSIFQSPTYTHMNGSPSLNGVNTTCVELHVDISKGDITIDETLHPGEISQCDTSSSSRKISVGSNDYVIETVGAHTANVFVTRKKCKKRAKAVKLAVP